MAEQKPELRYLDLKNDICKQIYLGTYADGDHIPSERRTEQSRLRRVRPIQRATSAAPGQNKSGTAEVYYAFVSYLGDKGVFLFYAKTKRR